MQGGKSFHSVRFEGSADAISFVAAAAGPITIDSGSTFGETSPGIDLNWISASNPQGLYGADIHGNSHLGKGVILQSVSNSHLQLITGFSVGGSFPATNVSLKGYVGDSFIEANTFTFGPNYLDNGVELIQNDGELTSGGLKVIYGPHTPTQVRATFGSAPVLQPFGVAPANPVNGELVTADCVNWKPGGCTAQTLVQYNGTAWAPISSETPMTAITATAPLTANGSSGSAQTGAVTIAVPTASSSVEGVVKTDGRTISNSNGTISCTTATTSQIGCSEPDGNTITISSGKLSAVASAATKVVSFSYPSAWSAVVLSGINVMYPSTATTITRVYFSALGTDLLNCTKSPTFVIKQGGTTLYTLTLTNSTYNYDSGALSVAATSGTAITFSTTAGVGCSGGGTGFTAFMNYK
jgi:hypothetical protein